MNESNNWNYLSKPMQLSFIACPGIFEPVLEYNILSNKDQEILKIKIQHILQVAIEHGHTTIILSALGCGAWKNPPKQVAYILKQY
jgi:uncharacterized protein (TIGR02452 family)